VDLVECTNRDKDGYGVYGLVRGHSYSSSPTTAPLLIAIILTRVSEAFENIPSTCLTCSMWTELETNTGQDDYHLASIQVAVKEIVYVLYV
jgi:Na+/H+ antiporter NhaD/arsenite permease-like protein